ncbi:MAG: hypothetical protein EXR86_00135 [Gammaproteobacteria bacterium]|nr:hypothetical protein [Gammaproteobacteria bacterium]
MVAVYNEDQVNTYFNSNQYDPAVAALSGGGYVVTWISQVQDPDGSYGIYAQRFTVSGIATGPEFRVNSTAGGTQYLPTITGRSNGGFVITWTDQVANDGSSYGVYAQAYDANALPQGSQFRVNTITASTQYEPAISAYNGGFIVTWSSFQDAASSSYGIYAQRYTNAGVQVLTNGLNEFRVNTTLANYQTESDVATAADGSFVVVWRSQSQDSGTDGVYAQRYDATGTPILTGGVNEFRVNTFVTGPQYEPKVALLTGGGFVVVWRSDNQDGSSAGVYGQRYTAAGALDGGEFRVNESTTGGQYQPDVEALANGGFVVTWYNDNYGVVQGVGTTADVYVREYDASGNALGGQLKADTGTPSGAQYEPAIAHIGSDNYVVVWRSDQPQDGSAAGIFQQLFGTAAELPRQANPDVGDFAGVVTFGENLVNASLQVLDSAVSVADLDSANFDGGQVQLFFVQGANNTDDQLGVVHQGNGFGQIGVAGANVSFGGTTIGTIAGGVNGASLTITLNANATVDAVEAPLQRLGYGNSSSSPLASRTLGLRVSDGDGGVSDASTLTVNITKELDGAPVVYGESQVTTYTPAEQTYPTVATLTDGSYVVAWNSDDQDGNQEGVYVQRFTAQGLALGAEFRVNSLTNGIQNYPQLASLSDGGYVVA